MAEAETFLAKLHSSWSSRRTPFGAQTQRLESSLGLGDKSAPVSLATVAPSSETTEALDRWNSVNAALTPPKFRAMNSIARSYRPHGQGECYMPNAAHSRAAALWPSQTVLDKTAAGYKCTRA